MSAPAPHLPRFRLFDGPSPLTRLPRFSTALGHRVEVWVKREDLLPLAFGGNKLRNLEFLVGAALAEGADTLITSGRRWSNHCRLTAAAGAKAGLAVELVLSGPPVDPPGPGVGLMRALGAVVHELPDADRAGREAEVERVAASVRARSGRPYVIGVGGSGAIGAWGQVLAGIELFDQAAAAGLAIDRIVVPSATGGTQAGLIVAAAGRSPATGVRGVIVARPASELRPTIESMIADLAAMAASDAAASSGAPAAPAAPAGASPKDPRAATVTSAANPDSHLAIDFDESQLGDGYGRPTAEATDATELLARTEGILTDPIYTAKALAGLIASVRSGAWDRERIVFWHAGGLPGIFEPLG